MWLLKPEIFIYISGTMTHDRNSKGTRVGFPTMLSSKELSPGDCNNDRQPEMAIYTFWAVANLAISG